jgi:hypothetical protein
MQPELVLSRKLFLYLIMMDVPMTELNAMLLKSAFVEGVFSLTEPRVAPFSQREDI